MPAQLLALNEGFRILLDKPILLIGRDSECDIQLDSRKVSRRHCCIAQVADYLVIRDLGSTNGIRINGARVSEGRLHTGDELTIGNNRYQVRWDSEDRGHQSAGNGFNHAKPAAVPVVGREAVNDDQLESCEIPMPLQDPIEPPQPRVALPAPEIPKAQPAPAPGPIEAPHNEASHLMLPDNLELAPISDVFPAFPSRPPHR